VGCPPIGDAGARSSSVTVIVPCLFGISRVSPHSFHRDAL
jgi:hypothetical protein